MRILRALLAALAIGGLGIAAAQDCAIEHEPNDTPAEAVELGGQRCFVGDLAGDAQDAWWWTVTEEEAKRPWRIAIQGIPGQLTQIDIVRITFAEDGVGVTAADRLLRFGTTDGELATSGPFLLGPGRYMLGISKSGGGGEYVVQLLGDEDAHRRFGETSDDRERAGEFGVVGPLAEAHEIPWTLDEEAATYRWELSVLDGIADGTRVTLLAPDGGEIARGTTDGGERTFAGLGLEAGTHRIRLEGPSGTVAVRTRTQGRLTDGNEVEPNDAWNTANALSLDTPIEGVADGRDRYRIEIDEEAARGAWDLVLESEDLVEVTLHDGQRELLLQRRGHTGRVGDLVLEAGSYFLTIDRGDGGAYSLRMEPAGVPDAGFEREPNDELVVAAPLADDLTVRGELGAQDTDVFRFDVTGPPQLWRIQALGQGVRGVRTYDGGGTRQASVDGQGRIRLDNLVLLPGTNYVRIDGEGEYALRAMALGPAPEPPEEDPAAAAAPLRAAAAAGADGASDDVATADADDAAALAAAADPGPPPPPGTLELEPNDDETRSELLTAGRTRVGVLSNRDDVDTYRFFLANDAYVRIEAMPPEDGAVAFDTSGARRAVAGGSGEPAVLQQWLRAGDHTVRMWAATSSDGFYQLRLRHLDPLALPVDVEPNDDAESAVPLPPELVVEGRVGENRDDDFYALPVFDAATPMRFELEGEETRPTLFAEDARLTREDDGRYGAVLPAGAATQLRISGRGEYRVTFEFDAPPDPDELVARAAAPDLSLEVEDPVRSITAYWHQGQRVEGELTLVNAADEAREVALEAASSDFAVDVELPDALALGAGETRHVPFEVRLPDDVRDDQPIRIDFAARGDAGLASADLTLAPRCEAPPVGATPYWAVPSELLGHLNVAWQPFGATVTNRAGDSDDYVNDGYTSPGRGSFRELGEAIVMDLPGDEPFALTGTLLHPQSRTVGSQLRAFELDVSQDGASWTTVLQGELAAPRLEQAFVLDEPVLARHVRLRFLDAQAGGRGAWVGEWKVLAEEAPSLPPFDLADPRLGGVMVWSDPLLPENAVLEGAPRRPTVDGRDLEEATWVVGFHHGRTAQVQRLEWLESDRSDEASRFGRVVVEASLAGPVGPWREVADWALDRDAAGEASFAFDEPVWARYLRFRASGHEAARTVHVPEVVRVLERPPGEAYRSILGAWGHYRPVGPYEAAHPPTATRASVEEDGDDTPQTARPLASGDRVVGSVAVGEDEDWLRITIPEGQNLLELRLAGDPAIDYRYGLTDAAGEPVNHEVEEDGEAVLLRVFGDPGEYLLHLEEPERSVVFSWDTSGSVGPFEAITYASVARFSRAVDPEREVVQMLAFDDPTPAWLMPYWSGDTQRVMRSVNEFVRGSVDSSQAEIAMLHLVRALGDREGTRAAVFITDHESGSYNRSAELWREIQEVRPRLFTMEISSGGSGITQDRMQAYAAVDRGHYDYARNVGDFDVGFARAACHLRRAKRYEVQVATRWQEPPGPGALTVVRGDDAALPAVEVIFDASGSMGAALPDGTPKIDAAKGVLDTLVGEILPEGVPFALRAFGHLTPQSCESRLDVPLAPLEREAARGAIAAIQPKLLSQTPIADALSQVGSDLADAGPGRTVVLITDGEESCGGDPEAALQALRDEGVDVRLSIVSLGVDDEAARASFEALAAAGDGTYAAADDTEALRASVEEALNPPFEVLDPAGEVVARGRLDGEAVSLPMGTYAVRIPGAPPTLLRDVRVPGDGAVEVTFEGP